ncbi:MAG: metallophosphoesterase family protein [Treponema sp.]|nr:metallophosphoesterase family protein [Treponema sp.]
MKYAIISDIHGNFPALQAILKDAKNQNINHYLFAGDYCLSGPWPMVGVQMTSTYVME